MGEQKGHKFVSLRLSDDILQSTSRFTFPGSDPGMFCLKSSESGLLIIIVAYYRMCCVCGFRVLDSRMITRYSPAHVSDASMLMSSHAEWKYMRSPIGCLVLVVVIRLTSSTKRSIR